MRKLHLFFPEFIYFLYIFLCVWIFIYNYRFMFVWTFVIHKMKLQKTTTWQLFSIARKFVFLIISSSIIIIVIVFSVHCQNHTIYLYLYILCCRYFDFSDFIFVFVPNLYYLSVDNCQCTDSYKRIPANSTQIFCSKKYW